MKIVLIGYMGSGKSAVGKRLSEEMNLPFKDLDEEIQNAEGMSVPEIFSKKGEIYFRKKENEILKRLLASKQDFILATGGGTPCYADSLSAMLNAEETTTVYLKTPLPILGERLMPERKDRPLLAHLNSIEDLMEFVGIHLFERSHYYNQAELIVETMDKVPKQIAKDIVAKLF